MELSPLLLSDVNRLHVDLTVRKRGMLSPTPAYDSLDRQRAVCAFVRSKRVRIETTIWSGRPGHGQNSAVKDDRVRGYLVEILEICAGREIELVIALEDRRYQRPRPHAPSAEQLAKLLASLPVNQLSKLTVQFGPLGVDQVARDAMEDAFEAFFARTPAACALERPRCTGRGGWTIDIATGRVITLTAGTEGNAEQVAAFFRRTFSTDNQINRLDISGVENIHSSASLLCFDNLTRLTLRDYSEGTYTPAFLGALRAPHLQSLQLRVKRLSKETFRILERLVAQGRLRHIALHLSTFDNTIIYQPLIEACVSHGCKLEIGWPIPDEPPVATQLWIPHAVAVHVSSLEWNLWRMDFDDPEVVRAAPQGVTFLRLGHLEISFGLSYDTNDDNGAYQYTILTMASRAHGFWHYLALFLGHNRFPLLRRLKIDATSTSLTHLFDIARAIGSSTMPSLASVEVTIDRLKHNEEDVQPTPDDSLARE